MYEENNDVINRCNMCLSADASGIRDHYSGDCGGAKGNWPYSQATKAGDFIFLSGQIPLDPKTGALVPGKIEDQTRQVLKNLNKVLASQGLTLENVVNTVVYLKDLNDFKAMNSVYAEGFSFATKPARATVEVSKLPMGALVEISCTAFVP